MRRDLRFVKAPRWLLAGVTAVVCAWVAVGSRTEGVGSEEVSQHSALTFDVSSTPVKDLYPGARKRTKLTVTNPYPFPIEVRSLEARLASTSKRSCRVIAANLQVGQHLGKLPLTVPAGKKKAAGEFELRMPNSVADDCQRTTFRLRITASARKAGR
ncbi:hypothetical protein B0I29_113106 [Actinoplanes lutulentus]|uniref:LEA14-like dessication related protein n=2 Tax=Actinoplanes lutulentus TaxID=1287878 RepID=A0A327Z983_9ACTN|nr:hypothetical protein B0I29_113106 [Actinoplanes lutulentus]